MSLKYVLVLMSATALLLADVQSSAVRQQEEKLTESLRTKEDALLATFRLKIRSLGFERSRARERQRVERL